MDLDEHTGSRLRALGERERGELDADAQARIAARIGEQGPRVVRRARRVRQAWQVGAALSVLGLAWGASRLIGSQAPEVAGSHGQPPPAAERGREAQANEPGRVPAAAIAARRACEQRVLPEPRRVADARDGAERFVLGALGDVLAEPGSALWLDASDPCKVRVRLLAGEVAVRADDLAGGELRVVTDRGDVVVHGTVFSVARRAGELRVQVAEGKVSVVQHQEVRVPAITAGQRARLRDGQAPTVEALPEGERTALLARVAPVVETAATTATAAAANAPAGPTASAQPHASAAREPSTVRANGKDAPRRSAGALVQEADALWRDGQHEPARARYREAGALGGPTAEAAWLALARRELGENRAAAVQQALREHATRFPSGALAAEAAGIAFRLAAQRGDRAAARQQAELLVRRHPRTPQADAAARWLADNPVP